MVDLKQQLNAIDYFGVVAVWLSFFSIIFIISVTCILWCCVSKDDDSTVFAKGTAIVLFLIPKNARILKGKRTKTALANRSLGCASHATSMGYRGVWNGPSSTPEDTNTRRVSFNIITVVQLI